MPPDSRHAEHFCELGCGRWGDFGFSPDPLLPERDRVMRWYCADHRTIGAAELARWKSRPEEPSTNAAPAKPGQGRFL